MNKDELNMSDRLSRRDFLKVAGAATVSTFLAACGFDPNSTEIDPTNTPLPIPISTKEIHSAGQYEFIEESEIISKLPGPFKAFTNDQKIKDLFTDPTSIEYSASGIKVYDLNDNPTAYTFFNATSTKEEKGRTAMIFGGDQGEVVYIVLNRIIDSDGSVGLGITQDPATGNDLEKSLMIFDTGLSETQIEKMTIKELSSINVNFIPGGILVPSEKLLGSKVQAMLLKPESLLPKKYTPDEINQMTPAEILAKAPELEGYEKWRAAGKYAMYINTQGQVEKAYDMTIGEYRDIPDYPVTTPENFRQNKISVDELLNGDYFLSLQKLAKQLECSPTMRTDVPLMPLGGLILYDQSSTPNFDVPGSEPFIRDYTSAYVEFPLTDGQVVDYAVMPLFMCDLNDNTKVYPIITVASAFHASMNQEKSNQIMFGGNGLFARWRKDMNITVIITSDKLTGARSGMQDPLVAQVFERYGEEEMKNRFDRYISGDFEALSAPDMVLLNLIATPKDGSGRILDVYK